VEQTTPATADFASQAGTFWSAQHAPGTLSPWPPLPANFNSLPVWDLGDGVWLLDDLDFDYATPQTESLAAGGGMRAMDDSGPPSPGDGGSDTNSDDGNASPNGLPAPNYGTNLWIANFTLSSGNAVGIVSNTLADISYEIQSTEYLPQSNWNSEGFIIGSELTNWTPMSVIQGSQTNLFLRIRSWASSDGSGLPDWWELEYFGHTGVDPNADPAGDGWSNIQKFQNGMNPNVFYTPPAPKGLTVSYISGSNTASISWQPSPGSVTGYTVQKYDGATGLITNYNFGTNINSFVDNVASDLPDPFVIGDILQVTYEVQAQYGALGDSYWGGPASLEPNSLTASFIAGPQGSAYVAVPIVPAGTVTLRVTRFDHTAWSDNRIYHLNAPYLTNLDIPISSATNGLYLIPSSWCVMPPDAYGDASGYEWTVQTLNTNGLPIATGAAYVGYIFPVEDNRGWLVPPYFDGRVQLKQNLIFLLRAAIAGSPFAYAGVNNSDLYNFTNPTGYVYAGFYQLDENANDSLWYEYIGSFDAYWPFENNYRYLNFVFNSSELDGNGRITTGVGGNYEENYILNSGINGDGYFDGGLYLLYPMTDQFQPPAASGATISALLATNQTKWLASYALDSSSDYLPEIGITNNMGTGVYSMYSNARNVYGLSFLSANIAYNAGSSIGTNTLYAGGNTAQGGYFYPETAQPQFQTVEYDFWNPYMDALPGMTNFSTVSTSRLMITSVGNPDFQVVGYAKLAVTNGYSGVYGYLGQYFTNA
jgi:hypothetical protein